MKKFLLSNKLVFCLLFISFFLVICAMLQVETPASSVAQLYQARVEIK